jgi:hypothetical protein
MSVFKNTVRAFLGIMLCIRAVVALEKTEDERLNGANVCFDIRKSNNMLTFIGKESGKDTFKFDVRESDFDTFTEFSSGNFEIERLRGAISWKYRSDEGFFQVMVNANGDMTLGDSPQNYSEFDRCKTYAFRTSGILENHGDRAFYSLVTSANAFHNYGTIQAYEAHFYNNYLFNSGIMRLGEKPIAVGDLKKDGPVVTAKPRFKMKMIENHGQFISEGGLSVKDGLTYRELGESVMENLRMSGGDIEVFKGRMDVKGTLYGEVGRLVVMTDSGIAYFNRFENLPGDLACSNKGNLYIPDGERPRMESLELAREKERRNRLGDAAYKRYLRIRNGEILSEYERQNYKSRYGRSWIEEAAKRTHIPSVVGGGAAGSIAAVGAGLVVSKLVKHSHVSVGVSTSGDVHVRAGNSRRYEEDLEEARRRFREQHRECDFSSSHTSWARPPSYTPYTPPSYTPSYYAPVYPSPEEERMKKLVRTEGMARARLYTPLSEYVPSQNRITVDPQTRIHQVFSVDPEKEKVRQRLYSGINRQLRPGLDMPRFLSGIRDQMTGTFGIPAPDVESLLRDRTVTDALYRVKRFNDYTVPSNSATEVIRSLERDAKKDRSWFDRYFRPTIEEFRERKESLMRSVDHDPVGNLVREHPWIVVKAAEHTLKRSAVSAGVTMVLRHPAFAALAIAVEGYNIYKSFTEYMEGGKDAVTRNCSSRSGPSKPPRADLEYGKGKFWEGLKTKKDDSTLVAISRKAKADVRMDSNGFFYKFDPAHKITKVHLHKYRHLGSGRYQLIEEVDPVSGARKIITDGKVEIW